MIHRIFIVMIDFIFQNLCVFFDRNFLTLLRFSISSDFVIYFILNGHFYSMISLWKQQYSDRSQSRSKCAACDCWHERRSVVFISLLLFWKTNQFVLLSHGSKPIRIELVFVTEWITEILRVDNCKCTVAHQLSWNECDWFELGTIHKGNIRFTYLRAHWKFSNFRTISTSFTLKLIH